LALKYAFTYAGREAARDARLMHDAARPDESATGWGPPKDSLAKSQCE
jgi:hypothetical protein